MSPEQREQRLQDRRESARLRRQAQSAEQRQNQLDIRRQLAHTVDKFKTDLQTTLVHCHVCSCLIFADKAKSLSSTILNELSDTYTQSTTDTVVLCSKCNTQILKQQWPSWAADNALSPDNIPLQLASLSCDEVRSE